MVEDVEVGTIKDDGDCEDETVKKLAFISKNSNEATGSLTPSAKQVFTQLRQAFTKALIL